MTRSGVLFHAKHAYMPNSLGFCGPDDRGRILRSLEGAGEGDALVRTLKEFEAAYPFLKLIAKSSGRDPFDYSVPEAYWIGNGLLSSVGQSEFYHFSHRELRGRDRAGVKEAFRELDGGAIPHHSFYVMSTFASASVPDGPRVGVDGDAKMGKMIDDCRISWGTVKKVEEKTLRVEYKPVKLSEGRLFLGSPSVKEVLYNKEVAPFEKVGSGDVVSLHWGYACDVLTPRQARNISRYTSLDVARTNVLLKTLRTSG